MRGNRNIIWIVVVIILVAIIAIVAIGNNNDDNESSNMMKMKVGHINLANDLPAFVAQEKGFFADEDLDVELIKFDSSKLATDAIYNGDINASAGSSTIPLLAAESTQPDKAKIYGLGFTGNQEDTTLGAFVVLESSSLQNPQDLEGKKVAIFPGGTAEVLLTRYLTNQGIDVSTIEWVEQVPSLWVPSLQNGSVDAVFAYESVLTIFKNDQDSPVRVFGYGALESEIDPLYLGGATVNTDFMNGNEEATKAYIKAFYKGIDFINENEAEAREILAQYTGTPIEVANVMNLYPVAKLNEIDKDKFQELADLLFAEDVLTSQVDTFTMYIDEKYVL